MNLDEWIAVLEECIRYLKIPDTRNLTDWENLYGLLIKLREQKEKQDIAYQKGYKDGWNSCVRDSADGWIIDYID
jgi:hypothetical protein